MNTAQLKIVARYNKKRQEYFDYAANTTHPSNDHKTAIALRLAEDALIVSCMGDNPMWIEYSNRSYALRSTLENFGLPLSIAAFANTL